MAFVAVEANCQEKVGGVFHQRVRRSQNLVIRGRGIFDRRATRRQNAFRKLIVRHACNVFADQRSMGQGMCGITASTTGIKSKFCGPLITIVTENVFPRPTIGSVGAPGCFGPSDFPVHQNDRLH